ncbi:nuclear transport factor 2 family protein [Fodinibius salsisoli]|uniref:Nuclear transport factor 2 family protein n=1 Tax=Fodinibius salsisoli TaxID=2820877 RepID=A0ABT3PII6_9BACT|nr:nuclear transport factor 2 family protein [Fodinibius salsisoli]MCW9705563.1 nuclear transport factor 2 family protein [Fodinibius salsisoli]
MLNQELVDAVKKLIQNATRYNIEALDAIYHDDLRIAKMESNQEIRVMDKGENIALFKSKKEAGDDPLSTESTFRYAHASGPVGHVAVERRMKLHDQEEHLLFNLVLRKVDEEWKIVSEFAIPLDSEG